MKVLSASLYLVSLPDSYYKIMEEQIQAKFILENTDKLSATVVSKDGK